ncbi:MAG: hypothetical protein ACUVWR_10005 [Anaerolineae bacterium]
MLHDALRLIASGGVGSSEQLAQKLGVEPGLARQMLEELVRLGYLRPAGGECRAACAKCPYADACLSLPQMWLLTEKGKRAVGVRLRHSNG